MLRQVISPARLGWPCRGAVTPATQALLRKDASQGISSQTTTSTSASVLTTTTTTFSLLPIYQLRTQSSVSSLFFSSFHLIPYSIVSSPIYFFPKNPQSHLHPMLARTENIIFDFPPSQAFPLAIYSKTLEMVQRVSSFQKSSSRSSSKNCRT